MSNEIRCSGDFLATKGCTFLVNLILFITCSNKYSARTQMPTLISHNPSHIYLIIMSTFVYKKTQQFVMNCTQTIKQTDGQRDRRTKIDR